MRKIAAGLVVLIGAVWWFGGFGARGEVAKAKALEKIDSLLGKMDVQRTEIDHELRSLKNAVTGIKKAKIKAQVKHDQIGRQAEPLRDQIAQADTTLRKLRGYLEAGEPVEIAGKTYTPDDLKKMASDVIETRKGHVQQMAGLEKSQAELQKVIAGLDRKQRGIESRISGMESQIAQIDAQADALKAMKDASATLGDNDATLEENVASLEDKVNDLFTDVQVEMAVESEEWDLATAEGEIDSVDVFISATQGSGDTISEIDRILGEGN